MDDPPLMEMRESARQGEGLGRGWRRRKKKKREKKENITSQRKQQQQQQQLISSHYKSRASFSVFAVAVMLFTPLWLVKL